MLIHTHHVIIAQADAASAHHCVKLGITPLSIACPAVLRFGRPPVRVRRGIRIALGTGFQTDTDTHENSNSNPFLHSHPHTNAHAHLYSNTYAISDSDPAAATHTIPGPRNDSRPNSNSHSYTNAFTHPNAYSDGCTHSNTYPDDHSHSNAYSHACAHSNAYSHACAHSNIYPDDHSSFIPGAGLRDSSDCHANADPLSNPHFIPHTHTNAISYSYTNAGTHCPASGNASGLHRSGWTPFMRPPLRRFAHLLGERRQGTIVSSSRPHVHRTQPWRRPYLWPRGRRFARVLG